MTKPHVSPSQIELFTKCPEAWRRRYVEGDKIPPGLAQARGTGVHAAAERNFSQKVETRVDMPPRETVEAAVAGFEAALAAGYVLNQDEESAGAANSIGKAKDSTASLAGLYALEVAPEYQPQYVEQKITIALPECSHDLLGIIDCATEDKKIVDLKTASKSKSQDEADQSVQLTIYAAAYHALTGSPAEELRLDTLVATKTPKRSTLVTTRTTEDYRALASRISAVVNSITVGSFPPASPGAWWCSPKWCGYYRTCPYVAKR